MTTKTLATIAVGLAIAAPLGIASQASAVTIITTVKPVASCPCSTTNPLGTLPATTLLKNTSTKHYVYDYTFDIIPPLGDGVTSQTQATFTTHSGATPELINFTLFTNLDPPTLVDPNDVPVAGTNWGTSPLALASVLNVDLPAGHYFLQIDYVAANKETLSGGVTVNPVPEPASWALMLVGFGGLGYALRSRRKLAKARV